MAFTRDDIVKDTPTNTFATLNSISGSTATTSNGNLIAVMNNAATEIPATLGFTVGKWYCEAVYTNLGAEGLLGVTLGQVYTNANLSSNSDGYAHFRSGGGELYTDTAATVSGWGTGWGVGTVIGIYVDNGDVYFYRDGVIQAGGSPAYRAGTNKTIYFSFSDASSGYSATVNVNFGQDPTFSNYKVPTKVYTDASGHGRFFYEPPAGAMALCTANLDTANLQPAEYIVDETNQHMLTYNGNAQISKFSPYTTDGWSINFDGSSELLYTNTNIYNLNFLDWMDQNNVETDKIGTIEAWIYLQDFSTGTSGSGQYTDRCILGRGGTFLNFGVRRDGKLRLYMYNSKNQYWTETDNAVITLRRWHHVAVSTYYDSNAGFAKVRMFIDGIEKNSTSYDDGVSEGNNRFWGSDFTNTTSGYENIYIGREGSEPATSRWIGYIKDLRVTKDSLYTTNFSVPTSNLQKLTNTVLLIGNSTSFNDASDNAFIFSPVGQPSISDWSPYQRSNDFDTAFFRAKDNYYGGSFYFDGTSYIDASPITAIGTGDYTIEAWVYHTDISGQQTYTSDTYSAQAGIYFYKNSSHQIGIYYTSQIITGSTVLKANQWYHVCAKRESGQIYLYVNGVSDATPVSDTLNLTETVFTVGDSKGTSSGTMKGYISDLRFNRSAVTPTTGGPTSKISSVANTDLLLQPWHTKTSAGVMSLIDSYPQDETGKSLTYYNGATIVDSSPYKGSNFGSFYFSGSSQYIKHEQINQFNLGSNDFTIETWIKFNNLSTLYPNILNSSATNWAIYYNNNLKYFVFAVDGTAYNSTAYTASVGEWIHYSYVRNGNAGQHYLNGTALGNSNDFTSINPTTSGALFIGSNPTPGDYLYGLLSDIRITLNQALYIADFTPPAYPLSATHYTTDGTDPATSSTKQVITGTVALLTQPGKVTKRNNVAAQDPDAYMKAVKYTGQTTADAGTWDSGTNTSTIAVGFQADLLWLKGRNYGEHNALFDSVRGITNILQSNRVFGEGPTTQHVQSVGSTDFTIGTNHEVNNANSTFVAWCFRAGGAPTADNLVAASTGNAMTDDSVSIDGVLQSSTTNNAYTPTGTPTIYPTRMSVNTKAGFSIVKYGGSNTTGLLSSSVSSATIPHGLSGCDFCIIKNIKWSNTWVVSHSSIAPNVMSLQDAGAANSTPPVDSTYGQITTLGSNTVTITRGTSRGDNVGEDYDAGGGQFEYIMYCWHSVPGFSAFGSYTGNGSTTGTEPFVYTGFKPAWLIIKRSDTTNDGWYIYDNARSPYNVVTGGLRANSPNQEDGSQACDFLSNGFRIRIGANGNFNATNGTYIYAAFAEQPIKFSNAR